MINVNKIPTEVLDIIMEYVKTLSDLLECDKVSKLFRQESSKWLFGEFDVSPFAEFEKTVS